METFEEIVAKLSGRSAFTTEPIRKARSLFDIMNDKNKDKTESPYSKVKRENAAEGVQRGHKNTNKKRNQDTIVREPQIKNDIAEEAGDGLFQRGRSTNRNYEIGNGSRVWGRWSPNQVIEYLTNKFGESKFNPVRPDMVLGKKEAPVYIWNPRWNYRQPLSPKYGLSVQNLGGNRYLSELGLRYIDWEGNLTRDINKAQLRDKLTGEILTEPPAAMPVEEIRNRYEPVMANDLDNPQLIYSMGKEKDYYRELEMLMSQEYNVQMEIQRRLRQYAKDTGIPFERLLMDRATEENPQEGVYDAVRKDVLAKYNKDEEIARQKAAKQQREYDKLREQAAGLAQDRLDKHIAQYKEYLANPSAFTEPVPQPKGVWVFGTGDAMNKGHYSHAPQLRQYFREELAKLLGEPAPEPEDDFIPGEYKEAVAERYPELKKIMDDLSDEQLKRMYDRGYDYDRFYTTDDEGNRTLRQIGDAATPEDTLDPEKAIRRFLQLEQGEDEWHQKHRADKIQEAKDRISQNALKDMERSVENQVKQAERIFAQYGVPLTPERVEDLKARLRNEYMEQLNFQENGLPLGNIFVGESARDIENRPDDLRRAAINERLNYLLNNHDSNREDPADTEDTDFAMFVGNYMQANDRYNRLKAMLASAKNNPNVDTYHLAKRVEEVRAKVEEMRDQIFEGAQDRGYFDKLNSSTLFNTSVSPDGKLRAFDEETGDINPSLRKLIVGPQRRNTLLRSLAHAPEDVDDLINVMKQNNKLPMTSRLPNDKGGLFNKYKAPVVPSSLQDIYDQTATNIYWKLLKLYGGTIPKNFRDRLDTAIETTKYNMDRAGISDAKRERIAAMNAGDMADEETYTGRDATAMETNQAFMNDLVKAAKKRVGLSHEAELMERLKPIMDKVREYSANGEEVPTRSLKMGVLMALRDMPWEDEEAHRKFVEGLSSKGVRADVAPELTPRQARQLIGEKEAWQGDHYRLAIAKFQYANELLENAIEKNISEPFQADLFDKIIDSPSRSWQNIQKEIINYCNEHPGALKKDETGATIGHTDQIAYAAEHLNRAHRAIPEGVNMSSIAQPADMNFDRRRALENELSNIVAHGVKEQYRQEVHNALNTWVQGNLEDPDQTVNIPKYMMIPEASPEKQIAKMSKIMRELQFLNENHPGEEGVVSRAKFNGGNMDDEKGDKALDEIAQTYDAIGEYRRSITDAAGNPKLPEAIMNEVENGDPFIAEARMDALRNGGDVDAARKQVIARAQSDATAASVGRNAAGMSLDHPVLTPDLDPTRAVRVKGAIRNTDESGNKTYTDFEGNPIEPGSGGASQPYQLKPQNTGGVGGYNLDLAKEQNKVAAEERVTPPDLDDDARAQAEGEASAKAALEAQKRKEESDNVQNAIKHAENIGKYMTSSDPVEQVLSKRINEGVFQDTSGEKEGYGGYNYGSDDDEFNKSWSMKNMEQMSIREMMNAIAKSDSKEGHPYGKPIQGNVFAYGSTVSTLGDGRDAPMPETIPTKKTNEDGATSRKLDL